MYKKTKKYGLKRSPFFFFDIYSSRYIYNTIQDNTCQGGTGVLADFMQKSKGKNSLFLEIVVVKSKEETK